MQTIELDYKRYFGAQIGIHNPDGDRIGVVSHVRNKEYIDLVSAQPLNLAETEELTSALTTCP